MKKIRYCWSGCAENLPMIGQLLASVRGRNAYLIVGIVAGPRSAEDDRGEFDCTLSLTVERVPRSQIDIPGQIVHGIVWDSRAPKNQKRPQGFPRGRSVGQKTLRTGA